MGPPLVLVLETGGTGGTGGTELSGTNEVVGLVSAVSLFNGGLLLKVGSGPQNSATDLISAVG